MSSWLRERGLKIWTGSRVRPRHVRELLRCVALALTVFWAWGRVYRIFDLHPFSIPVHYGGDAWFSAGVIKAAADGDYLPFVSKLIPHLGAPFVASWNDFPIPEELLFWFWGLWARWVGLFMAINIAYVSAAIAAALTLYLVARTFRVRWYFAFLAGALYGLSPYLFHRSTHHFNLTFFWHLPLCALICFWAGSRRGVRLGDHRFIAAVVVTMAAAFQNPYYLNFYLQILFLSTLAGAARFKRWSRVIPSLALVGVAGLCFISVNLHTLVYRAEHGPNPEATYRNPNDVELYAFKPLDLLVPPPSHPVPAFRTVSQLYQAQSLVRGEFPGSYLGAVTALAFLWLMGHTVWRLLLGRVDGMSRWGLLAVWLMSYCIAGGWNGILGLYGLPLFRSCNRVSIFLAGFAVLFLARRLSSLMRRLPDFAGIAFAVGLLALAVWEQTPAPHSDDEVRKLVSTVGADQDLVLRAESRLGPGAQVLQLPPMAFPEVGASYQVSDYELFRPYFFSKNLHFSYGNIKGRPETRWQFQVAGLSPDRQRQVLEERGFSAVYVNRKGFSAGWVEHWLAGLQGSGATEVLQSTLGDSLFVLLGPEGKKPQP